MLPTGQVQPAGTSTPSNGRVGIAAPTFEFRPGGKGEDVTKRQDACQEDQTARELARSITALLRICAKSLDRFTNTRPPSLLARRSLPIVNSGTTRFAH